MWFGRAGWKRLLLLPFAVALITSRLGAQVDSERVKIRNEGIPALVSAWSSSRWDRTELELLVTSTRVFADQRIVDTLFSILNQPSREVNVRVAALLVLLTFADPAVLPDFDNFLGDSTELLVTYYGRIDHPFPVIGRATLPAPVTERLREALQTVAASDPDPQMRVAARVALQNGPLR